MLLGEGKTNGQERANLTVEGLLGWPVERPPSLMPEEARQLDLEKRQGRLESSVVACCDTDRPYAYASGDPHDYFFDSHGLHLVSGCRLYAASQRTGPSAHHGEHRRRTAWRVRPLRATAQPAHSWRAFRRRSGWHPSASCPVSNT